MQSEPYIIVPNLIEQPTWGGDYIARFKGLTDSDILAKKIGQSYELYEQTNLSSKISTVDNPSIELAHPEDPEKTHLIFQDDAILAISELIKLDPEAILGTRYVQKFGPRMKTLIKFTQGRGNSYQIHVRKPVGKWLPKPESWYFFEPGIITLGVKEGVDWAAYEKTCHDIQSFTEGLSRQIHDYTLDLPTARQQLEKFIEQHNPEQFANLMKVSKDQAIDLSKCGIHHSWEEDDEYTPNGNILYEIQENVYDEVSTIRSFDKGKIKPDGSIRETQIDDYFAFIDRSNTANNPVNHISQNEYIIKTDTASVQQIFRTDSYFLQEIQFTDRFNEQIDDSFHHLFVKEGEIVLASAHKKITATKGFSIFVPAGIKDYQLSTSARATILKTYF